MSVDSKPDEAVSIETWREAAAGRDLLVGAAVAIEPLVEDERYRALLATQCSVLVAENAMKPTYLQPEPGVFDFRGPEPLFAFAKEHEQKVRGHTLVWHQQMPQWMKDPPMMLDMQAVLRAHVHGVTDYYRGKVFAWDVVNEAFEGDGSYRNSPWFGWLGEAYLSDSFTWARQHDPEAELFYNDYGIEEINPKSDAVYQWCRRALDRGVPIDGIGFQMHITSGGVNIESMARNFERFARLGLKLHITEMDVRLKLGEDGGVTAQQLEEQARNTRELLSVAMRQPAVEAVLFWGIYDGRSWVPGHFKGRGAALPFDRDYQPKPMHEAVLEAIEFRQATPEG